MRGALILLTAMSCLAGCDRAGNGNGNGSARPNVAPPVLSPIELLPAAVNRQAVGQVTLHNPPAVASTQTDLFTQHPGQADILWVVDNSGSMANERLVLGQNFASFFNELVAEQTDFQMAVISMDPTDNGVIRANNSDGGNPGLIKIITKSTPHAQSVFVENTTFPNSRVHWSQGLRMSEFALTPPDLDPNNPSSPNYGFLRPNAALAIIAISNADDMSYGNPNYYVRFLKGVKGKGDENLTTLSTIAGTIPTGCYPPGDLGVYEGLAQPAFRYDEVTTKTSGVFASICDPSFQVALLSIAEAINTLRRIFPLSLAPTAGTIVVTVNGVVIPQDAVNGWTYIAVTNSVAFEGNYVPPPNASINISYAIAGP